MAQALRLQVVLAELTAVDQELCVTPEKAFAVSAPRSQMPESRVDQEKKRRRRKASDKGGVRAHHRVLHGVRDEEYEGEVEGCELPHFPLPRETKAREDEGVDDGRSKGNDPYLGRGRQELIHDPG